MSFKVYALPGAVLVLVISFAWALGFWAGGDVNRRSQEVVEKDNLVDLQYLAGAPASYEVVCNQPISRDYADLCQQWRSAEVNERAALYSLFQMAISIVSAVGLVATIILTSRATAAAIAANSIARDMGERQVKAYVSWLGYRHSIARDNDDKLTGILVVPTIKNTGQSPATLLQMYSHLYEAHVGELPSLKFDLANSDVDNELGAGNEFNMAAQFLTTQQLVSIYEGRRKFYLLGCGKYRDVFWQVGQADRTFHFCFDVQTLSDPRVLDREANAQVLHLHSVSKYELAARE